MDNFKEYVINSIKNGKTSLGTAKYLSDDAKNALCRMVMVELDKNHTEADGSDVFDLITKASKIEEKVDEYVEKASSDWIIKLFEIPSSTISIEMDIVQTIDKSNVRTKPEDRIADSSSIPEKIFNEVSKRRLLLSLVSGASIYLSSNKKWLSIFSKISSELPGLYSEIIRKRLVTIYSRDKKYGLTDSFSTEVLIADSGCKPEIVCMATCAPLLIEATIRGILELSITHGLPTNQKIASYIIGKSDFSLANKWDLMIGIPLWKKIIESIKKSGHYIFEIGPNFLLMEFSKMKSEDLFSLINAILIGSRDGIIKIGKICSMILKGKEGDDFDDFVEIANNKFPLNDEYITTEELRAESSE